MIVSQFNLRSFDLITSDVYNEKVASWGNIEYGVLPLGCPDH